jgi:hypothetical protein
MERIERLPIRAAAQLFPLPRKPMSPPTGPRPVLSAENSDRLKHALRLSQQLQTAAPDADTKLVELRTLLNQCRDGIRSQNPRHRRNRLQAVNKARNYLHFLPDMQHPEAPGRLRSAARRLRSALRTA